MIKLGTIGTSAITEKFVTHAKKNDNLKIVACYSRSKESAKNFIATHELKARAFDNFNDMIHEIDAIYIASPNGLHFEQALYFLNQQKHVLLEKPLTLEFKQALQLYEVALKNKVILMEAFKPIHLPQFAEVDEFVKKYLPFGATLSVNQYSSRMNDIKKGSFTSVFDAKLGKGSTYDMLVYPVEFAIALFGPVQEVKAFNQSLPNDTNIVNAVLLRHESNVITNIMCSKNASGQVRSEILSEDGVLSFDGVLKLEHIKLHEQAEHKSYDLFETQSKDSFVYEIDVFVKMILEDDLALAEYLLKLSCETVRVLNEVEAQK